MATLQLRITRTSVTYADPQRDTKGREEETRLRALMRGFSVHPQKDMQGIMPWCLGVLVVKPRLYGG
jgi:hypothetical protein